MQQITTRGVALSYVKYGESSIIAKIFTEEYGLRSFIVNSVRGSSKKGGKMAFFGPMTCLEVVAYFDEKKDINRVKELKCFAPFATVPFAPEKTALALFMAEVTLKVTRGEQQERELFEYLVRCMMALDQTGAPLSSFAITFLTGMAAFLGFGTDDAREILLQSRHNGAGAPQIAEFLRNKITGGFDDRTTLPRELTRECLDCLLDFYDLHIHHFHPLKTATVFREIF